MDDPADQNCVQPGLYHYPMALDTAAQYQLAATLRQAISAAPFYTPTMPRSGRPFSVRMTNLGPLGWVADKTGYRYQARHPETGKPWPPMPPELTGIWQRYGGYAAPPQAALINWYKPDAKMGLHQDSDERDLAAPVVSISLGDEANFRFQAPAGGAGKSIRLQSGDVLVMAGVMRLCRHGVTRIYPGTSTVLEAPGRLNITLRRVD